MDNNGIFETLQKITGCLYISDLTQQANRKSVIQALENLKPEVFSQKQWRDLADYFGCGGSLTETSEEIRMRLINKLS